MSSSANRSSSQGEIALFSNLTLNDPSGAAAGVRGLVPPRHRVPMFELQPLEPDDASSPAVERRFNGRILKSCFFCKAEIGRKKDIYLYGCFQAFCSALCRAQQILRDGYMKLEEFDESIFADDPTKKNGA